MPLKLQDCKRWSYSCFTSGNTLDYTSEKLPKYSLAVLITQCDKLFKTKKRIIVPDLTTHACIQDSLGTQTLACLLYGNNTSLPDRLKCTWASVEAWKLLKHDLLQFV